MINLFSECFSPFNPIFVKIFINRNLSIKEVEPYHIRLLLFLTAIVYFIFKVQAITDDDTNVEVFICTY